MTLALVLAAAALLIFPSPAVAAVRTKVIRSRTADGGPADDRDTDGVESRRWRPRRRSNAADTLATAAGWDMLAACLRAGLPVPDALRAISAGMPADARSVLRKTGDLLALGASPDEAWAPSRASVATAPLAAAARRSAHSGAALAGAAAELAVRVRAELSDAAEAKAQRAGVLITGPLGLCFLPAFLCLGVVPVVVGLAGQLTVLR